MMLDEPKDLNAPQGTPITDPKEIEEAIAKIKANQPKPNTTLGELIKSKLQPASKELQDLGVKVGKLYTDHGFPIDMALAKLDYTKQQKLSVLDGALWWLIEHKRLSGAPEKAIERQRKLNRQMVERYIEKDEVGAY